ncbi:ribonuclease BN [Sphingobacteriaceae bacterium]|nr:ribonuclease BN [Sphingobacteriaceae bacterium]
MKINKAAFKSGWSITKDSFSEFSDDKVLKLSAALAYYTIFSLPSMLIVIIGLCSIFYGKDAIQGEIFTEISGFIGKDAALQVQDVLKNTTLHHDNVLTTIVGFLTLLVAATGMFGEIQDSINSIWGLQTKPKKGFIKLLLNRLMSFSMVVVLGFILLVSLVLNALLEGLLHRLERYFSESVINYFFVLDYGLIIIATTVLFASILKVLPDAKIHWRDVWTGAFTTCLLFLLGKFLIGYYLKHNSSITAYGAAGSLILILLWVYYSAIILYFGAEFTQVYVRHKNRKIEPNKYAVWVEKNTVEKKLNTQINEHTTTIDNKVEKPS